MTVVVSSAKVPFAVKFEKCTPVAASEVELPFTRMLRAFPLVPTASTAVTPAPTVRFPCSAADELNVTVPLGLVIVRLPKQDWPQVARMLASGLTNDTA